MLPVVQPIGPYRDGQTVFIGFLTESLLYSVTEKEEKQEETHPLRLFFDFYRADASEPCSISMISTHSALFRAR